MKCVLFIVSNFCVQVQSMHDGEKAVITRIISEADEKESKAMKTRAEHDARKRRENEVIPPLYPISWI